MGAVPSAQACLHLNLFFERAAASNICPSAGSPHGQAMCLHMECAAKLLM